MTNKENIKKVLQDILATVAKSLNLKDYEVFPKNESPGNGFLSEFFTGEVVNKDNGKKIYVAVKKASVDGFSFDFGNEPLYKNEIMFYTQVFPALNKLQKEEGVRKPFHNIPRYLAGHADPEFMFVAMENLKSVGYNLADKGHFLDSNHLELIFKTYGKFHALSFSLKKKYPTFYNNLVRDFGIRNTYVDLFVADHMIEIHKIGYFGALKSFNPVAEADILTRLKRVENIKETVEDVIHYKGDYKCVIHGDCWSNNMLFKYKKSGELEDIKLLDFQLVCTSTPVHDLAYFFYAGASKENFDKLDFYLDLYYESFSNFSKELGNIPEELYPLNTLKEEWKHYGLMGIILGCQLWLVKLMDKADITRVLSQKGVPKEKYWEEWCEITTKIAKGAAFKEKTRGICLHAVEYGIL